MRKEAQRGDGEAYITRHRVATWDEKRRALAARPCPFSSHRLLHTHTHYTRICATWLRWSREQGLSGLGGEAPHKKVGEQALRKEAHTHSGRWETGPHGRDLSP